MSTIRRQSIISSGVVYIGFALGTVTNYLLAREFNPAQYGLVNGMFVAIGTILYFVASVGMPGYVGKFYPYYKDNLPPEKNDQMTWALLISLGGFLVTMLLGVIFRSRVVHFYQAQSAELVKYYYWIFPFGLGMTIFGVLEAYGWQVHQSVLTSYLREVQVRLTTLALIALYLTGVIGSFGIFVKLYALNYLLVALILLIYLSRSGRLHLTFSVSRVSRKFFKKIRTVVWMAWMSSVFFNLAFYFAQLVIAGVVVGGLTAVGIFTFAQFVGSLIQAPQRAVSAASMGPLAQAWKDKDHGRVSRIYHRSAINQLIFSIGMFVLIWINYRDGILVFHLKPAYLAGQMTFLFIGLARIVDMGTGVNSQVIVTSVHWRFELISGVVLVLLTIPLNYLLAKEIGLIGPAIADLITFSIYNGIRWFFLYRKFKLQPFDRKSVFTLLLGVAAFFICDRLFSQFHGLVWMIARSAAFIFLYSGGVLMLRLSEDAIPVWNTIKGRLQRIRSSERRL
jgi:O-antigen/teichoic acid export membrane protein